MLSAASLAQLFRATSCTIQTLLSIKVSEAVSSLPFSHSSSGSRGGEAEEEAEQQLWRTDWSWRGLTHAEELRCTGDTLCERAVKRLGSPNLSKAHQRCSKYQQHQKDVH